jgi:uncharacterized membrane protein
VATGAEARQDAAHRVPVTARTLDALAAAGHLDAHAYRRAREIAGLAPTATQWREFLLRALGIGGALLLGTAVVFFVAFNWAEMGRFAKLGLLEAAVAAAAIAAMLMRERPNVSQPAYLAATILTGALLAYVGQTYQTGADPWQLFAAWAALAIPFALAASWAPLWALLLVIANTAVTLHFGGTARLGWLFSPSGTAVALVCVNVAAAAAAEWAAARGFRDAFRILPRTAGLVAVGASTFGMLYFLFEGDGAGARRDPALLAAWLAVMAGGYWAWRVVHRDLLMLSAMALSGIVVVAAALARAMGGQADTFGIAIAAVIVGLSAWAAHWIRRLAQLDEAEERP